jgi:hypothetical protein
VEPGPIPPHERTWRHPSELGPRAHAEAPSGRANHTLALVGASGTLVVALIAVLVVVTSPRSGDESTTLSATTMPAFVTVSPTVTSPAALANGDRDIKRVPTPTLLLASLIAIPNEVASAPQSLTGKPHVAAALPKDEERVMVQTDEMTYHCTWADLPMLEMPDGSLVVDGDGSLVAEVDGGELIELAGFDDD